MNKNFVRKLVALLLLKLCCAPLGAADALPGYGADLTQTTVSGVSAGAFMAVQFHVAHSSMVVGTGVIAGGPYGCSEGSLWTAWRRCIRRDTEMSAQEVGQLKAHAEALAREAKIDPTTGLAKARVWTFSGTRDTFVSAPIVSAVLGFYGGYVDPMRLRHVGTIPAAHGMVTRGYGGACSTMERPYLNDCDFDAAGELLAYLLGPLRLPSAQEEGTLIAFDQNEFGEGGAYRHGMPEYGYAYVPRHCTAAACRVHIAFHGCLQHAEGIGDVFARHAGYNRWADTNDLIVLYPQVTRRWGWNPKRGGGFVFNPMACWDWWGYTGTEYQTRAGSQIKAVNAMLQRLASPRSLATFSN